MNPPRTTIAEFASRVLLRANDGDWLVLMAPALEQSRVIDELTGELAQLGGLPQVIHAAADVRGLIAQLVQGGTHISIVSGLDLDSEAWRRLDAMRSRLGGRAPVVAVIDRASADKMAASAPNILSWAGGAVFELQPEEERLSQAERDDRLTALRDAFGLTDAEVIKQAQEHLISPEPEFSEWLALLGRGDLIDR